MGALLSNGDAAEHVIFSPNSFMIAAAGFTIPVPAPSSSAELERLGARSRALSLSLSLPLRMVVVVVTHFLSLSRMEG